MIVRRVITALTVAALVLLGFLKLPGMALFPLLLIASVLCQAELYMMIHRKYPVAPYAGILMGVAWLASVFLLPALSTVKGASGPAWSVTFLPVLIFLFCVYILFSSKIEQPILTLATTLFGFLYVPFLLSFFLRVIQVEADVAFKIPTHRQGILLLLYIAAVVKVGDMGGFAFGKAFGRHKLAPSISPKKSWEGLAGSVFGSVLISTAFYFVATEHEWGSYCPFWERLTLWRAIGAGVLLACAGTLGDLIESRIKRDCDVKDSATFMPAGMGGVLDMFDSMLFAPALFYPYLLYCLANIPKG